MRSVAKVPPANSAAPQPRVWTDGPPQPRVYGTKKGAGAKDNEIGVEQTMEERGGTALLALLLGGLPPAAGADGATRRDPRR